MQENQYRYYNPPPKPKPPTPCFPSVCICCLNKKILELEAENAKLKRQLNQELDKNVVLTANFNDVKTAFANFTREMHMAGVGECRI